MENPLQWRREKSHDRTQRAINDEGDSRVNEIVNLKDVGNRRSSHLRMCTDWRRSSLWTITSYHVARYDKLVSMFLIQSPGLYKRVGRSYVLAQEKSRHTFSTRKPGCPGGWDACDKGPRFGTKEKDVAGAGYWVPGNNFRNRGAWEGLRHRGKVPYCYGIIDHLRNHEVNGNLGPGEDVGTGTSFSWSGGPGWDVIQGDEGRRTGRGLRLRVVTVDLILRWEESTVQRPAGRGICWVSVFGTILGTRGKGIHRSIGIIGKRLVLHGSKSGWEERRALDNWGRREGIQDGDLFGTKGRSGFSRDLAVIRTYAFSMFFCSGNLDWPAIASSSSKSSSTKGDVLEGEGVSSNVTLSDSLIFLLSCIWMRVIRIVPGCTFANDVTAKITTKNNITSIVCLVSGEELSVTRHMFGASAILDPFIGF
ncbi:hypothetical protein Tco_1121956 [Tanacetum coccineum]|uniref:Uncharacterized protein n=1 Tax=Tanacetum coccineum TaxID=301880 RepID=A0ABQ5J062_9ASTR